MLKTAEALNLLYTDPRYCAQLVGLNYVSPDAAGFTRLKHGKGFSFKDARNNAVNSRVVERIKKLVIPPAWKNVWIAPSPKDHVLATGVDERGRKQYIYHPKWRTSRDLIKFYRMIIFAGALPIIRRDINKNLKLRKLSFDKVMAVMLWILDNAYIRIGNYVYFAENDSVGLTTLTDENVVVAGDVVTLSFRGKSGKDHQITFDNPVVAKALNELRQVNGARLFRYVDSANDWHVITADDINKYLHELTRAKISAKDFRTWGGTFMAFIHLLEQQASSNKKPEKVVIDAIDSAASVLGNTRSVARSSYVHPHILNIYGSERFSEYYQKSKAKRKIIGLDQHESELVMFLESLFEDEFKLLKQGSR